MGETRWLRWFGPGLIALAALGLVGAATAGAGTGVTPPSSAASACADPPTGAIAMSGGPATISLADGSATPWFRLDPVIDRDGALAGQRLALGLDGVASARTLDLPAESFAAGPFGRVVLVGADDGTSSTVRLLDVSAGCTWPIATEQDVIRRATLDRGGSAIYEMRVDRRTRADLGIWLQPIGGGLPARQVLGAPPADGRFGRTWSTELSWDLRGDRLAVQSCGDVACRTRVVDPSGGPTGTLDAPDLGGLIGLDGDRLVTYAACRGLPCPIVSTDLGTGARTMLVPEAGPAVVVATDDGARLVAETGFGDARALRSVTLDGGGADDLGRIPDDLALQAGAAVAGSATELPPGWVLLAPYGRMPADGSTAGSRLRHLPDGATVPLAEAAR
ncbi:MAG TPA: hypothetical protein VGQ31_05475 [Candidatus Limnocylindrales bacterium]|nr:hypothetical protein [Candidatus Limnocylindrales bacterium]